MERLSAADRRLAWDGCVNVRDLGGLHCGDRTIRRGVLIRASTLGQLTAAGADTVRTHGIRTVIDIRWPHEIAALPSPFAPGTSYRNVPVDAGMRMDLHGNAVAGTLPALLVSLASRESGIADAIEAVASAEPAVVLHCQAGRDRTGFVVALILGAIGVDDKDIVSDYCASDEALATEYERFRAEHPEQAERLAETVAKRAWVMAAALGAMRSGYGDVGAYVRDAVGVSAQALTRLRQLLIA